MVDEFIKLGWTVVGCARDAQAIQALSTRLDDPHLFRVCDVSSESDVERFLDVRVVMAMLAAICIGSAVALGALMRTPPDARLGRKLAQALGIVVDDGPHPALPARLQRALRTEHEHRGGGQREQQEQRDQAPLQRVPPAPVRRLPAPAARGPQARTPAKV